ncbi:ankyrin repeat and zinc finger domain-containing protein 1 [Aaosphaeria arxii CBS 175.79]|uniref:Ankyrin repeat and zinc finger domain-containing protein 1 n=1 Tax=Aaosphaeria arxii CBS 175.79 TaxID=1450172 RepID=A0A6A5XQA8_9PLEO|nr:ankyrin repeat and zinc finger domain-containing protein 1 [Aaosphaeria arxii CBS 175.79]KAF2015448.1 ankyrin repeat and zinc finger domain-containing protein 1 [Aaosphaeria arxii CBS 175.79]
MAQKTGKVEQLLQRPLYVFDLPEEILSTLTLKDQPAQITPDTPPQIPTPASETSEKPDTENGPAKATACNLCGLTFPSVAAQRDHVRSDLHGYNLKLKLKGAKPVNEDEFEKLVGDLDESISGSDSSESDTEENEEDGGKAKDSTLSALLKKQAKISNPEFDEFASKKKQRGAGKPPLFWFTSPLLPENTSLGVYRAIFSDAEQEEESHIIDTIRKKQLSPKSIPKLNPDGGVPLPKTDVGPHFFLCMIGGGHFAAMIVALAPKTGKKNGIDERSATVIAHKTYHRYTTRRKQGGSQSANDASKGNAHSAGSSLRRYNEAALTSDVRNLLQGWKELIDSADLVFIRASGVTNRRTLFGPYDGQVLRNNDPRNRGFPFNTRRATQKELMRAFVELTRVKQSTIDEAALAALDQSQANEAPAAKPAKPKPQKPSKEEEVAMLHTSQLIPLIRRSKVPALLNYIKTNDIPPTFRFSPENHHAPTPLHLAGSTRSPLVVSALLTKAKADPTVLSDAAHTPYSLAAGDRATEDAFRLARFELGEAAWDWEKAGVPSPLSKSEVDKRDAEEKAAKAAEDNAESARRKAETERLRKESRAEEERKLESRIGKGKTLGAAMQKTGAEKREEDARGLTPEARARLERERRARAAEERFKRMQGN